MWCCNKSRSCKAARLAAAKDIRRFFLRFERLEPLERFEQSV
jgi:hypothetical protein